MRRALKRVTIALVALLALVLVARVLLDRWGERRLAEHRKTLEVEIAAERDRIAELRMPVVSGGPIDENAAAGYKRVFETVRGIEQELRNSRRHEVLFGAPSHPHDPISPDQTAILDLLREPTFTYRRHDSLPLGPILRPVVEYYTRRLIRCVLPKIANRIRASFYYQRFSPTLAFATRTISPKQQIIRALRALRRRATLAPIDVQEDGRTRLTKDWRRFPCAN